MISLLQLPAAALAWPQLVEDIDDSIIILC